MTKLLNNSIPAGNTVKLRRHRPLHELNNNKRKIKMFNDLYTEDRLQLSYSVRTIIPSRGIARYRIFASDFGILILM